jgi:IMP dehydrogenase
MYKNANLDIAKVGIGPGGTCITRMIAGVGFPQLSAIFETTSSGMPVIADGGIKKPADFAKAIAAGSFAVMIGSLFGGTDETPGKVINGKKIVRGQASHSYMKDNGVKRNQFRSAEGVTLEVATKGPVANVLAELMGGLRSAMSYTGAKNISEYWEKAIFSNVSNATLSENIPWLSSK